MAKASQDGPGPVEAYTANLPAKERAALLRLRRLILSVAPEATEAMSYGMPAFKLDGRPIAGFAAFKDHLSLFPMSGSILGALAADLKGFKTAKATVQFTLEGPLPDALVKKIVRARIREIQDKGK